MFYQQLLEYDTIPTAIPVQDTTSHMISHDSFQQPLQNNMYGSGEMLQPISVGRLEIIKAQKSIANFSTELFTNSYQEQNNLVDPPPPPVSPSVCCNYSTKHIPTYCRCLPLIPYKSLMDTVML